MFGQSPFDDDPFFADHRNAMNSMMRGFGGGFGGGFNAIEGRFGFNYGRFAEVSMKHNIKVTGP